MSEITNIPDLIYLQVDPDEWITDDEGQTDVDFHKLAVDHEVTWCEDAVNNSDVAYLKQTPTRTLAAQLYLASKNLLFHCQLADAQGDLSDYIDGIYLDELQSIHSAIEQLVVDELVGD